MPMMRILDRTLVGWLVLGWFAVGLIVDPHAAVPFRDEKQALFLIFSGFLGVLSGLWMCRGGVSRDFGGICWPLLPLGGLLIHRVLESLREPEVLGVLEPGLPARTDYLLRIVAPLAGALLVWVASSQLSLSAGRARRVSVALFGLLTLESAGVLCEIAGAFFGHEWRPFFLGAGLSEAQGGLKATLFGSIGNPNFLASYLAVLVLPVLVIGGSRERSRGSRYLALAVVLLAVGIVVMCRSKGALLALFGAAALTGLTHKVLTGRRAEQPKASHRGRFFMGGLLVAVVVVGALFSSFVSGSRHESALESWARSLRLRGESASQRVLLAHIGARQWSESRVFGIGPGEFRLRFIPELAEALSEEGEMLSARVAKLKSLRPIHVHNDYLEFMVEWGLFGYAAAMGFLALAFTRALRALGSCSGGLFLSRLGFLGGSFTGGLYALFEFPLHLPTHLCLVAALLGLAGAEDREVVTEQPRSARILGGIAGTLAILMGAGLVWHGVQMSRASHLARSAGELAAGGESERGRAVSLMKRAAQADPGNGDLGLSLAQFQWKLEGLAASARGTLRRTARISDDPHLALVETEILIAEGKFQEAAGALAPLLQVGPYLPGVGFLEGRILEARGENESAAAAYQRDQAAMGNHPEIRHLDEPLLYLRHAAVLEALGKPREALEQYRKHVRALGTRASNIPIAHLRMGRIYRDHLEDYGAAETAFAEALAASERGGSAAEAENARRELTETRERRLQVTPK